MRTIQLSVVTLLGLNTLLMAGGDIQEITPFEMEEIQSIEREVQVIPPVKVPVVRTTIIEEKAPIVLPLKNTLASSLGGYTGLGLTAVRYDTNCGCSKKSGIDTTAGFIARVGYDFNKYIGVEGRGIITTFKDDGGKVKHLGAFVKPMYPITEDLTTYGLLGLAKTTTQGTLRHTDTNGLALGLGLEYDLSSNKEKSNGGFGLFADYEKLYVKSNAPKLDALSIGLTYDF